jgi:hypothetical protein
MRHFEIDGMSSTGAERHGRRKRGRENTSLH